MFFTCILSVCISTLVPSTCILFSLTHLCEQVLELLVQRDKEFQELMRIASRQGRTHEEMQKLEKEVEKRDGDIQLLQKQLKEAEHILVSMSM